MPWRLSVARWLSSRSYASRTQGADLQVRIGIHLGDVVDQDGDLFGTAVNIAARLEGIAQPGGIVVSAAVRDAIAGKLAASFADLGLKTLKNIERAAASLCAFTKNCLRLTWRASAPGEVLPLPSKPSIAVLPFENLSGDRDQEYFADGIVEEIITALVALPPAIRHRPQFELHLQGSCRGREAGRARTGGALRD